MVKRPIKQAKRWIREAMKYWSCMRRNEPYFGRLMGSALVDSVRKTYMIGLAKHEFSHGQTVKLLEVGCWAGSSARVWTDALESIGAKGLIVCVDWWRHVESIYDGALSKPPGMPSGESLATDKRIFSLFLHNLVYSRANENGITVAPFRGNSTVLLPLFGDEVFNLVYVDGDHRYSGAAADIRNAIHLVKEGGILCGDDLELQSTEVNLEHAAREREKDATQDPKTGLWFHPGVTLAVSELLGPVSVYDGFWVVRKRAQGWDPVTL